MMMSALYVSDSRGSPAKVLAQISSSSAPSFSTLPVILIDGGYLDKVLDHDFAKARVDIGRLGDELAAGMERLRTYYYHCMPHQSTPPTSGSALNLCP